jgi:hypothetical protein
MPESGRHADTGRESHGGVPEGAPPGIHLPAPSVWPAACGLGVALLMFGIVTSPWFGLLGLLVMALAIAAWIDEVLHEPA